MPYLLFLKKRHIFNCRLLQIIGGTLRVNCHGCHLSGTLVLLSIYYLTVIKTIVENWMNSKTKCGNVSLSEIIYGNWIMK